VDIFSLCDSMDRKLDMIFWIVIPLSCFSVSELLHVFHRLHRSDGRWMWTVDKMHSWCYLLLICLVVFRYVRNCVCFGISVLQLSIWRVLVLYSLLQWICELKHMDQWLVAET
jgi:hypothetical protein